MSVKTETALQILMQAGDSGEPKAADPGGALLAMAPKVSEAEVESPALPMDYEIAFRTAEMLAVPFLVCGLRKCRRQTMCGFHYGKILMPRCLPNLAPSMADDYLALYDCARQIAADSAGPGFLAAAADPLSQELQDAAVEIVRDTIRDPLRKKRFDAFCRGRENPPAAQTVRAVVADPESAGAGILAPGVLEPGILAAGSTEAQGALPENDLFGPAIADSAAARGAKAVATAAVPALMPEADRDRDGDDVAEWEARIAALCGSIRQASDEGPAVRFFDGAFACIR
ncbi:hypothetical protein [Neorhizobium alkalisoli]|uniref:Uncharacterized protein n=1 Tax=Neorhizobium alkalisoli TaxID=528178 RepID=A0A561QHC7_9HYPH|nr:hypothetical protein [Neorhizobium alkalisoli]TWF49793.1 hypothetical protein FHW37_107160 [Neorhizobium alkalisoli]